MIYVILIILVVIVIIGINIMRKSIKQNAVNVRKPGTFHTTKRRVKR